MSLLLPPIPLSAALPIEPNYFMAVMVVSACAYGVVIVFNYLSLKAKSTHRLAVASVILVVAGLLVGEASVGLTYDRDAPPLLKTIPGMLSIAILAVAACVSLVAFIHGSWHRHRFRRGRKRALGSLVASLIGIGALFGLAKFLNTPDAPAPKGKVELLPETDAYGRPLSTPKPSPAPSAVVTPAPPSTDPLPVPQVSLATPVPIATPRPQSLIPRTITP